MIVIFGVAIFVTFLGELSTLFSELTKANHSSEERNRQINELDEKFNIGSELVDRLQNYFEQNASLGSDSAQDMGYLFGLLPASLKI